MIKCLRRLHTEKIAFVLHSAHFNRTILIGHTVCWEIYIMKKNMVFFGIVILFFTALNGTCYSGINDGLAAYYPFNGNANDESGNGSNGTVYGATLVADRFGNPDSAYQFDGVDDVINCGDTSYFDFGTGFTFAAWIKVSEFN